MSGTFSVKNFEKFQHYKDRSPPWIKLYNELLDDYDFGLLPDASKWHLVAIWLLASRSNNEIPLDPAWVQKRICASSPVDLTILKNAGFIQYNQNRSKPLAKRKQVDDLEREGQVQGEKKDIVQTPFDLFFKAYPRKEARGAASKAFDKALEKADAPTLIAAASAYAGKRAGQDKQFTKLPATWLNQECWLDEGIAPAPEPDAEATSKASTAWDGRAAPLVAKIGPAQFGAWFGEAKFDAGPPTRIVFTTPFRRQWVNSHFRDELERIYGETHLEVAA